VKTVKYFIINAKNYPEASGTGLDRLTNALAIVSAKARFKTNVIFHLAPPNFGLQSSVSKDESYGILAQHLDAEKEVGASTGFLVPEIAKSFGAVGSLINHSEHRIPENEIERLVIRLKRLEMISVVCAKDDLEVETFSGYSPDFIAVEPPELIGSGRAVSKAKPEIIMASRRALESSRPPDSQTRLLCGAGIVEGIDARLSVETGAEGILVASGIIKASDWENKIEELTQGLIDARQPAVSQLSK
jgi:triosephosphate isomerase (TIM)